MNVVKHKTSNTCSTKQKYMPVVVVVKLPDYIVTFLKTFTIRVRCLQTKLK